MATENLLDNAPAPVEEDLLNDSPQEVEEAFDPRFTQAASLVSNTPSSELPVDLARRAVEDRIQRIISAGFNPATAQATIAEAKSLADRHAKPQATDAVMGAQQVLASDSKEDMKYTYSFEDVTAQRRGVRNQIGAMLKELKDKSSSSQDIAAFASTVLHGNQFAGISAVLSEIDPTFTLSDVATLGGAMQRIREKVLSLSPEEAKERLPLFVAAAKKAAFLMTQGNAFTTDATASMIMQEIFGGMDEGDERGTFESVINGLEALSVTLPVLGPVIGKGLQASARARAAERPSTRGELAIKKLFDSPAPTHAPGSPGWAAATTKKGQESMAASLERGEDALLTAKGIEPAAAVDDMYVPNADLDLPPTSSFGFDEVYLTAEERAAAVGRVVNQASERWSTRLKDSNIVYTEDGFEAQVRLGKKDGRGFNSESTANLQARTHLGLKPGEYQLVKSADTDEWFVQVNESRKYGTGDAGMYDPADQKSVWSRLIAGSNVAFSKKLTEGATWAARVSAEEKVKMNEVLASYRALSGSDLGAVNSLLKESNGRKWWTAEELAERGYSQKQIDAVMAVNAVSKYDYMKTNEWVRLKLETEGFKQTMVGDKPMIVKQLAPGNAHLGDHVIDMSTGERINAPSSTAGMTVYHIIGDKGSPRHGILRGGKAPLTLTDLPHNPVKKIEGYLPIMYNQPAFIRRLNADGSTEAVETAGSMARANERAAELGSDYRAFRASEISENADARNYSELEDLMERGMLYTSQRNPEMLKDADGVDNIMSVADSINAMVHSAAKQSGISRWAEVAKARWNNTYAEEFGDFNMAKLPARADATTEKAWKEAQQLRTHIQMMEGTHVNQLNIATQGWRNMLADQLFKASNLPVVGGGVNALARNISGVSAGLSEGARKAAFGVYLGLNPARQAVVQMSMIPTYMGIKGASGYLTSGAFFRDITDLNMAVHGVERAGAKELAEQWRKYGGNAFVDDHLYMLGQTADLGGKAASYGVGRAIGLAEKIAVSSKAAGFDFGTRRDKMAQFLIARNRFVATEGRLPETTAEWKGVTDFAEALGFNMNASDPLFTNSGSLISSVSQFATFAIKSGFRALALEKNGRFTARERYGMALASLMSYGTAGYGANMAVQKGLEAIGVKLNEDDRQVLENGINGIIMDSVFTAAQDEGEKDAQLASGRTMGPFSRGFWGITPDAVYNATQGRLQLGYLTENSPIQANFPAISLAGQVGDAVGIIGKMFGETDEPLSSKGAFAATQLLKTFPVYGNAFKGILAHNMGYAVDASGKPIVEASSGEAMARAIFGFPSRSEVNLNAAMSRLTGPFEGIDSPGGIIGTVEEAADATAGWLIPMITSEKGINRAEYDRLMEMHGHLMGAGLDPEQRRAYYDRLHERVMASDVSREQRFIERLYKEKNKTPSRDIRDIIDDFDLDSDAAQNLRTLINSWIGEE